MGQARSGELARQQEWQALWGVLRSATLLRAVGAMGLFRGWLPDDQAEQALFRRLAAASSAMIGEAAAPAVATLTTRHSNHVAFSTDLTQIAVGPSYGDPRCTVHSRSDGALIAEFDLTGEPSPWARQLVYVDDAVVNLEWREHEEYRGRHWTIVRHRRPDWRREVLAEAVVGHSVRIGAVPGGFVVVSPDGIRFGTADGPLGEPRSVPGLSGGDMVLLATDPASGRMAVTLDYQQLFVLDSDLRVLGEIGRREEAALAWFCGPDTLVTLGRFNALCSWTPGLGSATGHTWVSKDDVNYGSFALELSFSPVPSLGLLAFARSVDDPLWYDARTLKSVPGPSAFTGQFPLWMSPQDRYLVTREHDGLQAHEVALRVVAQLVTTPMRAMGSVDLEAVRAVRNRPLTPAATLAAELLQMCLEHRLLSRRAPAPDGLEASGDAPEPATDAIDPIDPIEDQPFSGVDASNPFALAHAKSAHARRLARIGRVDEAVTLAGEVADFWRGDATDGPSTAHYVTALQSLAEQLARAGRYEAARTTFDEAVRLTRHQVEADEWGIDALAGVLKNYASHLSSTGMHSEAAAAGEEAVARYREYLEIDPAAEEDDEDDWDLDDDEDEDHRDLDRDELYLADALIDLGNRWNGAGRVDKAMEASGEAVTIIRRHVAADAEECEPRLALALNNLACQQQDMGDNAAARENANEAVALFTRLAAADPTEHERRLLLSRHTLALILSDLHRHDEALTAMLDVVALHRVLHRSEPYSFAGNLAEALTDYGRIRSRRGEHEAALSATAEAVPLIRPHAEQDPGRHAAGHARALTTFAEVRLAADESLLAARDAAGLAVALYRQLADAQPEAHRQRLADAESILERSR